MAHVMEAGFIRRINALVLDVVLAFVGFAFLNLLLYKLGLLPGPAADSPHPLSVWLQPGALAVAAAVGSIAVIACWRWQRGTPGALLMGANVVCATDGSHAGSARLALRFAVGMFLGGVGLLWSLGGRRALHDRLSGTRMVLEDENVVTLAELAANGTSP